MRAGESRTRYVIKKTHIKSRNKRKKETKKQRKKIIKKQSIKERR